MNGLRQHRENLRRESDDRRYGEIERKLDLILALLESPPAEKVTKVTKDADGTVVSTQISVTEPAEKVLKAEKK